MEGQNQIRERLSEQRAIASRTAKTQAAARATNTPRRRQNRQPAPQATGQLDVEETPTTDFADASEAQMAERLNADRARTSANQASIGFGPNVERLAEGGNIDEARLDAAKQQIADITQRMRAATTLAQVQALTQEYQTLENALTEEGLGTQTDKYVQAFRAALWRGLVDGGMVLDGILGETDGGIFTVAANAVVDFQFLYGRFLRDNPEPERTRSIFFPPPIRTTPAANDPDGQTIAKRVMVWWDTATFAMSPLIIGVSVTIGLAIIIILGGFGYCTSLGVLAVTDSFCQPFVGTIFEVVTGALGGS